MARRIMLAQTNSVLVQMFRYGLVGGFAFVLDFTLLYLLTESLKIHYLVSAALSFLAGLLTAYVLSVTWVFDRRTLQSKWAELAIFSFIGILGLGINELCIWFFTDSLGFHYLVSKIFTGGIVFLWNFFCRKWILFR